MFPREQFLYSREHRKNTYDRGKTSRRPSRAPRNQVWRLLQKDLSISNMGIASIVRPRMSIVNWSVSRQTVVKVSGVEYSKLDRWHVIRKDGGAIDFKMIITYLDTKTYITSHYQYTYTVKRNVVTDSFDKVNPDELNEALTESELESPATNEPAGDEIRMETVRWRFNRRKTPVSRCR